MIYLIYDSYWFTSYSEESERFRYGFIHEFMLSIGHTNILTQINFDQYQSLMMKETPSKQHAMIPHQINNTDYPVWIVLRRIASIGKCILF